jgi:hypothetical protein
MAIDVMGYGAILPSLQETEPGPWDEEVFGQPQVGHFWAQWMLERPKKERLRPDELTMERVRRSRGRFMLVVTDEQAAQIAPLFRGDAPSSQ